MSTATATTASPNISHLPHTAHPTPLREQAFTLHCEGLRSPAIAAELGVSERTIRSWIAAALKDDLQLSRKEQLLLAVERQHQLTAVAWQQFEAEAAARNALLDATLEPLDSLASSATGSGAAAARSISTCTCPPARLPRAISASSCKPTKKPTASSASTLSPSSSCSPPKPPLPPSRSPIPRFRQNRQPPSRTSTANLRQKRQPLSRQNRQAPSRA